MKVSFWLLLKKLSSKRTFLLINSWNQQFPEDRGEKKNHITNMSTEHSQLPKPQTTGLAVRISFIFYLSKSCPGSWKGQPDPVVQAWFTEDWQAASLWSRALSKAGDTGLFSLVTSSRTQGNSMKLCDSVLHWHPSLFQVSAFPPTPQIFLYWDISWILFRASVTNKGV